MVIKGLLLRAAKYAKKSACHEYRVGAIIANGSNIISFGKNRPYRQKEYRLAPTLSVHAEQEALLKRNMNVNGATIYVCTLTQRGRIGIGRPCPECLKLLKYYKIDKIVYSLRDKIGIEKI